MIFFHELRSNIKMLLIWTLCIAGFDFIMLLMYPSLQESMADLAASADKLGAFGTAFGMDQLNIGQPLGFYGTYIGVMLALCGAMFAAILGAGILSKEEGGHTVEYLYTLPYSRIHVVIQKVLAVFALILIFEVVNLLLGILGLEIIDAEVPMIKILIYHIGQTLLHLEVAAIGILISACNKKVNIGIGLGVALLFYFMDMMARIFEQLKGFQYITPFYYTNAVDVLNQGKFDPVLLIIGIVITIASMVAAGFVYNRRDLAA